VAHHKKLCELCGWIWSQPPVKVNEARGSSLDDLPERLTESGIVKVAAEDENECIERFTDRGAFVLPQYEAVRAGQEDPGVLETVAKATASEGDTSASVARDTDFHDDAYQFHCDYCGQRIAGIGNMPDIELLSFPKVVEGRFLMFSDLCGAARKFMLGHETGQFLRLTQTRFTIDSRYEQVDPNLSPPSTLAVIYGDALGFRFHIGGSVRSPDPLAGFSLSLFRAYMASTVITERLESGTLYVIDQRRIAHRGIRVPGVDVKTVLRRVLLGFPKAESK
jgi:hypothetical protein